ncbi:MAG: Zn-dependent exopeptidase M28 [Ignavibacteria bacterium]|nr:Zn-dependent exopeptidase M28 [Ignavibacteria bacterium]
MIVLALLITFIVGFSPPDDPEAVGPWLLELVRGIEGRSPEGRRQYITYQLRAMDVPYRTMTFDTTLVTPRRKTRITGENIVVSLGSGRRTIVLGAHFDAVPGSPGANDNGGGVAVLLGLIQSMHKRSWNHRVDIVFFDQEEEGLFGSIFYVQRATSRERHRAMINLDVVGVGDEIFVGPVGEGDDDTIMPIVRKASRELGARFQEHAFYPGSDHLSFADAGLENISISVVPRGDADRLAAFVRGDTIDRQNLPIVLRTMHTPQDNSSHLSPSALALAFEFTKRVLILLDSTN